MVFRVGYGIFYGLIQGNRQESTGIVNAPFLADELNNFNTQPVPMKTLANMFAPVSQGLNLVPLSFFQIDPDMRDPYFQQWNATIQKSIKDFFSFEASYVGSKGSKLEFSRPVNVPLPRPGAIQDRRLWTRFAAGSYVENGGYSTYNAFQTKAEIRAWHGLTLLSSYAFAKSIDNLSADVQGYSSQDPNNNNGEKGVSDFDVKQRWVTSINYSVPFGKTWKGPVGYLVRDWELGSIITAQSGLPFTPSISLTRRTQARVCVQIASPAVSLKRVRSRDTSIHQRSVFRLEYTFGNSGRNILYGRGFRNWDFIAVRNFRIRDRLYSSSGPSSSTSQTRRLSGSLPQTFSLRLWPRSCCRRNPATFSLL